MIIEMRLHNLGHLGWISEQRAEDSDIWTSHCTLMPQDRAIGILLRMACTTVFTLGHTVIFVDATESPFSDGQLSFGFEVAS